MRKKLLLLIGLIVSCGMMAAPVTLQQAQQRAQQFMNSRGSASAHGMRLAKQQLRVETAQQDNAYYYVFNVGEQQGFVIVSGDDRTPAILGYADQGSFADQDMPDNMRAWLQGYEDQMKWMDESGYQAAPAKKVNGVRSSINPLITTMWDQGKPYDRETPIAGITNVIDQNNNIVRIDTTFCVTGCVATAMAQIMYYHRWPKDATTDIPAYSSGWGSVGSTLPATTSGLPSVKFDWTKMYNTYTNDNFAPELAKLMRYCGQAVKMYYGTGESSASTPDVISALKEYFDYDNTATFIWRENYTAAQWADIIYAELQEERPVLYSGSSSGGGHAFIVDGYSEDEYYHINWGWSGRHNGYFLLSVLNPYANNESGASSSKDGYSFSQGAGIGIQQQKNLPLPDPVLSCMELTASSTNLTRYSNGFPIPYSCAFGNFSGMEGSFDVALGLFDKADNLLESSGLIGNNVSIQNNQYYSVGGSRTMGASLADGTYYLKMVYSKPGTEDWLKAKDADLYAITAVVEGTTMTLTNAVQPTVELTATTITADGTPEVGSPTTLTTSITNRGTGLFNGYLYLFVDGSLAGGKMFEVEGDQIKTFSIEYIPTSAGTKTVQIATDINGVNVIAERSIEISGSNVTTDNIELAITYDLLNCIDGKIMGNNLQVVANLENNENVNYNGRVYIYLRYKYTEGNITYSGWENVSSVLSIPANSTKKYEHTFTELDYNRVYNVEVKYIKNGSEVTGAPTLDSYLTPVEAYVLYSTDGIKTYGETTANISTDENVAFVDLRGQTTVQSVTSQANPNTIFLLDNNASITGATNVVKGSKADNITLTDGYDFFTPIAFTASSISYSRTAELAFNRTPEGWATVTLPFKVESVKVDDETIDWFHRSTDTGKNFWVMEFTGDNGGTVNFDYAKEMKAYTPYIFTVPGESYGAFSLKNKTLVFTGAKIKASSDANAVLTGSSYKFIGTTSAKSNLDDVYLLNAAGSTFEKTNNDSENSEKSFRAYFADTKNQSAANVLGISIGGGTPTGIADMLPAADKQVKAGVYNLNGVKMGDSLESLPAGIYVVNGKKVIK